MMGDLSVDGSVIGEKPKAQQGPVMGTNSHNVANPDACFDKAEFGDNMPPSNKSLVFASSKSTTKVIGQDPTNSEDEIFLPSSTHLVNTTDCCTHKVVVPANQDYVPLKPHEGPLAREYPFELDPFQKEAISCIQNSQSVFVAAHTSSGKTVIAEYAVAKALEQKQRIVYTTPIKALGNQKFSEFKEKFQDVGLLTGDVTENQDAACLIMTAEVLRGMIFRNDMLIHELQWIIFDEVHYMRDKERGVVWEETIMNLPQDVRYVFLSATLPNALQFAEWICHLRQQPCHVVSTEYRPVPLRQYIFSGGKNIYLAVDQKGGFREDNFNKALSEIDGERSTGENLTSNLYKIALKLFEDDLLPAIVFTFNKKECDSNALEVSQLDFNTTEEKKSVTEIFGKIVEQSIENHKSLLMIVKFQSLLERGIGIHHGGLLPILKETVEVLFAKGLIKVLFATETFSMGLNMPARAVVFTSVRKFDGIANRLISSGEYIQMSGRAGRRGLDSQGVVIIMLDEKISPSLLCGSAEWLDSSFHLTYSLLLNLLKMYRNDPQRLLRMLKGSFLDFQQREKIHQLRKNVKKKEDLMELNVLSYSAAIAESKFERSQYKKELEMKLKSAKDLLDNAISLLPMKQFKNRKHVLCKLCYINEDDLILLKGLFAQHISCADILLITEMAFSGLFMELDATQTAVLLSCFVCYGKPVKIPKLSGSLAVAQETMEDLARNIVRVSLEANVEMDENKYLGQFQPYMMDVVDAWCKESSFEDVCKLTDLFEGDIVQCMRRLVEFIREMGDASKNTGMIELDNKFNESITLLERGFIFADSFYLKTNENQGFGNSNDFEARGTRYSPSTSSP